MPIACIPITVILKSKYSQIVLTIYGQIRSHSSVKTSFQSAGPARISHSFWNGNGARMDGLNVESWMNKECLCWLGNCPEADKYIGADHEQNDEKMRHMVGMNKLEKSNHCLGHHKLSIIDVDLTFYWQKCFKYLLIIGMEWAFLFSSNLRTGEIIDLQRFYLWRMGNFIGGPRNKL